MDHPKLLKTAATATAALSFFFLCSLKGRSNHPDMEKLRGWAYAHRGLHREGVPENSMAAFRAALEKGYGIELDLHLMRDGNLAVIHDASLLRTAGVDVNIEDLTAEDLENYRLEGTDEKIPLFREVLELFDGKAPMIVELKAVGENYAALTEAACRMLEAYEGLYCIESFDPRCIQWLRKHHPHIIRGQLAADFKGKRLGQSPVTLFLLTHNMLNFLSVPDFVAYRFTDRKKTVSIPLCRYAWDIQGAAWTIRTREEYNAAVKEGWLPIFEGFEP